MYYKLTSNLGDANLKAKMSESMFQLQLPVSIRKMLAFTVVKVQPTFVRMNYSVS